jgi:hypothetical protein
MSKISNMNLRGENLEDLEPSTESMAEAAWKYPSLTKGDGLAVVQYGGDPRLKVYAI